MPSLAGLAAVSFLASATLMILFEGTATRIAGVSLMIAALVLGTFAIATAEFVADDADED